MKLRGGMASRVSSRRRQNFVDKCSGLFTYSIKSVLHVSELFAFTIYECVVQDGGRSNAAGTACGGVHCWPRLTDPRSAA